MSNRVYDGPGRTPNTNPKAARAPRPGEPAGDSFQHARASAVAPITNPKATPNQKAVKPTLMQKLAKGPKQAGRVR